MVLMLNQKNVIIDIVEEAKPIVRNRNNLIVPCIAGEPDGYIGSDGETVYARIGVQLQPSFYDIFRLVYVDEIPSHVKPLQWKYEEGFEMNLDGYPDTNKGLTDRATDLEDMILEMSEIIYA